MKPEPLSKEKMNVGGNTLPMSEWFFAEDVFSAVELAKQKIKARAVPSSCKGVIASNTFLCNECIDICLEVVDSVFCFSKQKEAE